VALHPALATDWLPTDGGAVTTKRQHLLLFLQAPQAIALAGYAMGRWIMRWSRSEAAGDSARVTTDDIDGLICCLKTSFGIDRISAPQWAAADMGLRPRARSAACVPFARRLFGLADPYRLGCRFQPPPALGLPDGPATVLASVSVQSSRFLAMVQVTSDTRASFAEYGRWQSRPANGRIGAVVVVLITPAEAQSGRAHRCRLPRQINRGVHWSPGHLSRHQ